MTKGTAMSALSVRQCGIPTVEKTAGYHLKHCVRFVGQKRLSKRCLTMPNNVSVILERCPKCGYKPELWIEGSPQATLRDMTRLGRFKAFVAMVFDRMENNEVTGFSVVDYEEASDLLRATEGA